RKGIDVPERADVESILRVPEIVRSAVAEHVLAAAQVLFNCFYRRHEARVVFCEESHVVHRQQAGIQFRVTESLCETFLPAIPGFLADVTVNGCCLPAPVNCPLWTVEVRSDPGQVVAAGTAHAAGIRMNALSPTIFPEAGVRRVGQGRDSVAQAF